MERSTTSLVGVALVLAFAGGGLPADDVAGQCCVREQPAAEPSVHDHWKVVLECADAPPRLDREAGTEVGDDWSERFQRCTDAAKAVVRLGDEKDHGLLWSIFDELPDGSTLWRNAIAEAFLDWHAARAVASLDLKPGAFSPKIDPTAALPERLSTAPADLQQAWRLYDSWTRSYDQQRHAPQARGDGIPFQLHSADFYRVVAALLRGSLAPADAVTQLSRYTWGGMCGMGSESLYLPQAKASVIAFLELGRPDLAFAAGRAASGHFFPEGEPALAWDWRGLEAAGIDWEAFYVGGVLGGQRQLAEVLVRQGSESGLRQLVEAAAFLDVALLTDEPVYVTAEDLLWPLAALVEGQEDACSEYGTSDSREVTRDASASAVPADVQERVLDLLARKVGAGAGLSEADAASHLLLQLCRPESLDAFGAMRRSPFGEVRRRGTIGLRALGVAVPDAAPSAPVRFAIMLDGRPARNQGVAWTVKFGEGNYGGSVSSDGVTDADGVLPLDRDLFVDTRRRVTGVVIAFEDATSPKGTWVGAALGSPDGLDTPVVVEVGPRSAP